MAAIQYVETKLPSSVPNFGSWRTILRGHDFQMLTYMSTLTSIVEPLMRRHNISIPSLAELGPTGKYLGFNHHSNEIAKDAWHDTYKISPRLRCPMTETNPCLWRWCFRHCVMNSHRYGSETTTIGSTSKGRP
jgi:hypothetical protein